MTIKELLNQGIIMLKNEDIDGEIGKARAILQYTLKTSREYLIIYDKKEVTSNQRNEYVKNIKRLISGEPLQYITGLQEFMKINFLVTKDVLIPQPDTEILVEEVIDIAKTIENPVVLDLCTGSGAIAISLAKYVPNVKVVATDISSKALDIAKQNAKLNGVINNIEFIESNLFDKLKDRLKSNRRSEKLEDGLMDKKKNGKFDIIVSNPPYIPTKEIATLPKDVQQEPQIALDGGNDGLDFYRKFAKEGYKFLSRQGYLCLEIGYNQRKQVEKIIQGEKRYVETYSKKDLCQNDRVIVTRIG